MMEMSPPALMASMKALVPDLGHRSKILHELVLCHTSAKILDRDGRGFFVLDDLDEQILDGPGSSLTR